jgi:predicted O-methyltransferase YrrM
MTVRILKLTTALYDYVIANSVRESMVLKRLREETAKLNGAGMQIPPEQGQFMALLVTLMRARRCLEIGTFTGYSALCVAGALPADGTLICCDIDAKATAIAKRYWEEAGVAAKIDLRIGPALKTAESLITAGAAGTFDFVFIDADKKNYDGYYEAALKLLRPDGLIVFDNILWGGAVADDTANDTDTAALKKLNAKLHKDERISLSLLPIGDGVTLALKR